MKFKNNFLNTFFHISLYYIYIYNGYYNYNNLIVLLILYFDYINNK